MLHALLCYMHYYACSTEEMCPQYFLPSKLLEKCVELFPVYWRKCSIMMCRTQGVIQPHFNIIKTTSIIYRLNISYLGKDPNLME